MKALHIQYKYEQWLDKHHRQAADIAQTFLKLLPDFRRQEIQILKHLDAEL